MPYSGDSALRMPMEIVAKRTTRGTLIVNTLYIRPMVNGLGSRTQKPSNFKSFLGKYFSAFLFRMPWPIQCPRTVRWHWLHLKQTNATVYPAPIIRLSNNSSALHTDGRPPGPWLAVGTTATEKSEQSKSVTSKSAASNIPIHHVTW